MRQLAHGVLFAMVVAAAALGQGPLGDPIERGRPIAQLQKDAPRWFELGVAYRFRFEGREGNGFKRDSGESYGLSRALVEVGVKPKPWLNFRFQGQDARAPGKDNATGLFRDPFDVRQAWVQVGDAENGILHVRIGRQELLYGKQRLVGPLDWTNTARQFDAAKLTIGRKALHLDLFAASVVVIDPGELNKRRDGSNLHGACGTLDGLLDKGALEVYTLWKTNPRVVDALGRLGDEDLYTSGFRFERPLGAGFDMETEWARQYGRFAAEDVSAWGAYGVLGYTPPGWRWSPRFSAEYQFGSGDGDATDSRRGTFDQLYPTGHLFQGTADRIGWQNVKDARAGVSLKPHAKLGVTFDYFNFWLANRRDHLYAVNGAVSVRAPEGGARSSRVGQEADAILTWRPAAHATVGGGLGYFFTGDFLKETTPGRRHAFTYLFLNYVL
jgi:hypothetical protein